MLRQGRPKKVRYVQKMPKIVIFSPRGKPGRPDEVDLRVDHYEALKLADYEGLSQAEGAKIMGISRPSFGRILREARKRASDGLVNGKIIKIIIGDVQVGVRPRNFVFRQTKDLVHKNLSQYKIQDRGGRKTTKKQP